jgi:hypothetical protein
LGFTLGRTFANPCLGREPKAKVAIDGEEEQHEKQLKKKRRKEKTT